MSLNFADGWYHWTPGHAQDNVSFDKPALLYNSTYTTHVNIVGRYSKRSTGTCMHFVTCVWYMYACHLQHMVRAYMVCLT